MVMYKSLYIVFAESHTWLAISFLVMQIYLYIYIYFIIIKVGILEFMYSIYVKNKINKNCKCISSTCSDQ